MIDIINIILLIAVVFIFIALRSVLGKRTGLEKPVIFDIEEVVESDNRLRPGCSAAFSIVVDNDEVLVVIAELRNAKEKGANQIAADARQRVSQDHGVQVHTLVLIKPRTVEKTSSGGPIHGLLM